MLHFQKMPNASGLLHTLFFHKDASLDYLTHVIDEVTVTTAAGRCPPAFSMHLVTRENCSCLSAQFPLCPHNPQHPCQVRLRRVGLL